MTFPRDALRPARVAVLFAAAAVPFGIIVAIASWMRAPAPDRSTFAATSIGAEASEAVPIVLRLSGSNTIGSKLAPALVQGFMEQNMGATRVSSAETGPEEVLLRIALSKGDVEVEIRSHGSAHAFQDLLAGTCDIGMASRPVAVKEIAALRDIGLGDFTSPESEFVIGLDSLALVVNAKNPVHSLTRAQIRQVFGGDIRDWKELGGSAGGIFANRPS